MLTTFDVGPDYVGGLHAAITHAQALLREKEEMSTMQLRLHAGRYPLGGRPLNISVDGIELVADSSEETIISGGLRLEWSNTDDRSSSLWTSPVPASGSPRQLWRRAGGPPKVRSSPPGCPVSTDLGILAGSSSAGRGRHGGETQGGATRTRRNAARHAPQSPPYAHHRTKHT